MTRVPRISPLAWLDDVAQQRRDAGLRTIAARSASLQAMAFTPSSTWPPTTTSGSRRHPHVVDGAVRALHTWGAGSTGSRLVTGNTALHESFEDCTRRVRRRRVGPGFLVGLHGKPRRGRGVVGA